jgi:uncharacterized Tic20 family protein
MSLADELMKLQQLYESGAINADEYAAAKKRLLGGQSHVPTHLTDIDPAMLEQQARTWGMLLHLSVLAGYIVPIFGLVAPVVIWQLKKDELPGIDAHGKNALNWIISHLIYLVICVALFFFLIGIPLLMALGVMAVLFPIIAAIKANNGEIWRYPLTITFFE